MGWDCVVAVAVADHVDGSAAAWVSLLDVTRWMCANPAKQVSFDARKGSIAVGCDADLVIWNPDAQFTVSAVALQHRHKLTPYDGEVLSGVVQKSFLRGQKIYDEGKFIPAPTGLIILRKGLPQKGT